MEPVSSAAASGRYSIAPPANCGQRRKPWARTRRVNRHTIPFTHYVGKPVLIAVNHVFTRAPLIQSDFAIEVYP